MMLEKRIINQLEEYFNSPKASFESIALVIVNLRMLIEIKEVANDYPKVKFYCDWFLHSKLSWNSAKEVVLKIKVAIIETELKDDFLLQVSKIIGVQEFVIELKEIIYKYLKSRNNIDDDRFWIDFLKLYLNLITHKPILFSKEMKSLDMSDIGFDFKIYGLQFVDYEDSFKIEILSEQLEASNKNLYLDYNLYREN